MPPRAAKKIECGKVTSFSANVPCFIIFYHKVGEKENIKAMA